MDPRQDIAWDDLESDSGYPSDILSLEGMFSWSECGDSYTEGSDLPRSPVLIESEEEDQYMWPEEEEEEDDYPHIPVYVISSDDEEDFPEMPAGPDRYVGDYRGIPAGAESSDEDDFGLSHEIPAGTAGSVGFLWTPPSQPLETEDEGAAIPGPSRRHDSCEFSAGAETGAEGNETTDIVNPALDFSNEIPWYQRSVYWEGWYEDLMKDLDEEF